MFSLPNDSQRCAIIGRTGSGKTQAALWQLSLRSYPTRPWIVFDFKGDRSIADIPRAEVIALGTKLPSKPGIYIVRPLPFQADEVEAMLWAIWQRENIGLWFDEGYMVNKSNAFQALLTQGRSKSIPLIILTQRPVWINRFVWSESDFFQLFTLSNKQDRKVVLEMIPGAPESIPPYHSIWYEVAVDRKIILQPVPDRNIIFETFRARQPTRKLRQI